MIGEKHHEAVDAESDATGWRHAIHQGIDEVFIDRHGVFIAGLAVDLLGHEALPLVDWVVQFREGVRQFSAADVELKPFDVVGIRRGSLCQRREFDRIVDQEGRLDQVRADELLEQLVDDARPDGAGFDIGSGLPAPRSLVQRPSGGQRSRFRSGLRIASRSVIRFQGVARSIVVAIVAEGCANPDSGHGSCGNHAFEAFHHRGVVGKGFVELEHRELRGVRSVDPFVAEILADLVDPFETADDQPLQIELVGDPKVEGLIERVVVGRERPSRRAAVEWLQRWRFDFEVVQAVEICANRGHGSRAKDEDIADIFVGDQIGIALAVPQFFVLQPMPLFRRRI